MQDWRSLSSVVNRGILANGSNLNTLTNNGRWLLNHNGAYVNAPLANEEAQVIVEQQGSVIIQYFIQQRDGGTNSSYKGFRTSNNSGTNWSEWREELAIETFADDPRKDNGNYLPTRIGQFGYCDATDGFYLAYGTGQGEFIKLADETLIKNIVTIVVKPEVDVFGFVSSKGTTIQAQGFSITSTSGAPIVTSNNFGTSVDVPNGQVGIEYYRPDTTDPSQNYIKLVDRASTGMVSIIRNLTAKDWQDIWDFGASIEVKFRMDKTNANDFLGAFQIFFGANNPGFIIGEYADGTKPENVVGNAPYGINYPLRARRSGGNVTYRITKPRDANYNIFSATIPEDDWLVMTLKLDKADPGHLEIIHNGATAGKIPWGDFVSIIGSSDYDGLSSIGYSSASTGNVNNTEVQDMYITISRTDNTLVIPNRQASFLVVLPVGAKDWEVELNEITEGGGAFVGSTVKVLANNTGEVVVRPMTTDVLINGVNAPIRFTNGADKFNLTLEQIEVETGNEWVGTPVMSSASGVAVFDSTRGLEKETDGKVFVKLGDNMEFDTNGNVRCTITAGTLPFDNTGIEGQIPSTDIQGAISDLMNSIPTPQTAGDGIDITNNVISIKTGTGLELSTGGEIGLKIGDGVEINSDGAIELKNDYLIDTLISQPHTTTNAFDNMTIAIKNGFYLIAGTGAEGAASTLAYTETYIPVDPNKTYAIWAKDDGSTYRRFATVGQEYDENKNRIGGIQNEFSDFRNAWVLMKFRPNTRFARLNLTVSNVNRGFIAEANVFDMPSMTDGQRLDNSGNIVADGAYSITDFIQISSTNRHIAYLGLANFDPTPVTGSAYDENKKYIGTIPTLRGFADVLDLPEGTAYVRLNVITARKSNFKFAEILEGNKTRLPWIQVTENNLSDSLKSTIGISRWSGKKAVALGDSITFGHSVNDRPNNLWHQVMAKELGLRECVNYGISGTKIAQSDGEPATRAMSARYTAMDDDADLVLVFGGTNDYGHEATTGTPGTVWNSTAPFGKTTDRTNDTFYGALHVLFKGLRDKYVDADILVLTPLHRHGVGGNTTQAAESKNRVTNRSLLEYIFAIRDVAAYYAIPVYDTYAMTMANPVSNPAWATKYMPDRLHPNDAGSKLLGEKVATWIKGNL